MSGESGLLVSSRDLQDSLGEFKFSMGLDDADIAATLKLDIRAVEIDRSP